MASNWTNELERRGEDSSEEDYCLPFSDSEELECLNNSRGSEGSPRGVPQGGGSSTKDLMMVGEWLQFLPKNQHGR